MVSPLTQFTGAVSDGLSEAGRTGAIVAISTGLLAAVSLPAQAATSTSTSPSAGPAAVGPVAAAAPAYSAQPSANALAAGELSRGGSAFTAPSTTVVSFESGTFTAVPKPVVRQAAPAEEPSGRTETRRSTSTSSGSSSTTERSTSGTSSARGSSVLSIAARYVGTPYLYGGTTPNGFDCSGYTRYVFKQLGISLPRTANQQMNATKRISRSEARPGDLVFFVSGGSAYHNGIYAGNGMMYDAPRSGKTVQKREIWDATIVFGRVTG